MNTAFLAKARQRLETFLNGVDTITALQGQVANTAHSFAAGAATIAKVAEIGAFILSPFRLVTVISVPFEAARAIKNVRHIRGAPEMLKLYAALKSVVATGTVLDIAGTSVTILKDLGLPIIRQIAIAAVTISLVGIAFQITGIAVSIWSITEIEKQKSTFKKNIKSPGGIQGAIQELTGNYPKTKKADYKERFFGVLSQDQKNKVNAVHQKYQASALGGVSSMKKAILAVDRHFSHKTAQHAIQIAIMTIAGVGVVMLLFTPNPVAPVAWGLLGLSGILSLGLFAYAKIEDYMFTRTLARA